MGGSVLYRAYAVPYEWVPQLDKPAEVAVVPPSNGQPLIPDVNGNIPDILPRLDTSPTANKNEPSRLNIGAALSVFYQRLFRPCGR